MKRSFLSEEWAHFLPASCWSDAREEAQDILDLGAVTHLQGYDIDKVIDAARANAERAGVGHLIHFQQRPVSQLSHSGKYGFPDNKSAVWRASGRS